MEPIRARVIPLLILIAGVLVSLGILTDNQVAEILSYVSAALTIIVGVPLEESARNRATPTEKAGEILVLDPDGRSVPKTVWEAKSDALIIGNTDPVVVPRKNYSHEIEIEDGEAV